MRWQTCLDRIRRDMTRDVFCCWSIDQRRKGDTNFRTGKTQRTSKSVTRRCETNGRKAKDRLSLFRENSCRHRFDEIVVHKNSIFTQTFQMEISARDKKNFEMNSGD